jgi:predicted thioesterase
MDDPIGDSPEKKKTYKEIGAERRKAAQANISAKATWLGGWTEKIKNWSKSTAETVTDYTLATPDMVQDTAVAGVQYADKKLDQFATAVDDRAQKAEAALDRGIEASKKWTKDKVETAGAVAVLGGFLVAGAASSMVGKFEDAAYQAKEKVKSGYASVIEGGKARIDAARSKITAAGEKFRAWRIKRALENVAKQELEAKQKLTEALRKKNELLTSMFPSGTQAAA